MNINDILHRGPSTERPRARPSLLGIIGGVLILAALSGCMHDDGTPRGAFATKSILKGDEVPSGLHECELEDEGEETDEEIDPEDEDPWGDLPEPTGIGIQMFSPQSSGDCEAGEYVVGIGEYTFASTSDYQEWVECVKQTGSDDWDAEYDECDHMTGMWGNERIFIVMAFPTSEDEWMVDGMQESNEEVIDALQEKYPEMESNIETFP